MKKLVAVLTAAVFVAGAAALAAAQTGSTTPAPAPEKKMEKSEKKMAAKSASGTVKSASADSVVVAGKEKGKDAEWTFGVDAKTSIKKAGKTVAAADLKPGDSVTVRYVEHDGKAVAQSISVKGGGVAKAKKDEKPAAEAKPAEKK